MSMATQELERANRRLECTLQYAKQMAEAGKGPKEVLISWQRGFTDLPRNVSELERLKKKVINNNSLLSPAQRGYLAVYNGDENELRWVGIFWNSDRLPFGEPKVEVLG